MGVAQVTIASIVFRSLYFDSEPGPRRWNRKPRPQPLEGTNGNQGELGEDIFLEGTKGVPRNGGRK